MATALCLACLLRHKGRNVLALPNRIPSLTCASLSNSNSAPTVQQAARSDRVVQKRQADLEDRLQKFPIPRENLLFRSATLADKAQVLAIEPSIHYGLDYLQDYYDDIVTSDNKVGMVSVDKTDSAILSFGYAVITAEGRQMSCGGGRTQRRLRSCGLASLATRALYDMVKPRLHSAALCSGVYSLPGYTAAYFARLHGLVSVVMRNQQLGFEFGADCLAVLADRFAGSPAGAEEPRLVANPVDFLSSGDVCSAADNRLFKPGQHLLIAKEALTMSRANLVIWEKRLSQVMSSSSQSHASDGVTGVSIANWNSVPIGGHHLVLNIYCRTESQAVSHLAAQLRSAVQQIRLSDAKRDRLYISAFVPAHLLYNEVLSGVRIHPLIRDLPASSSPKLACDIRVGVWSPGTFV